MLSPQAKSTDRSEEENNSPEARNFNYALTEKQKVGESVYLCPGVTRCSAAADEEVKTFVSESCYERIKNILILFSSLF